MLNNIDEALNWLYSQRDNKKRTDLAKIKNAISLLNIKIGYPIIHITGTNGKGSTANYIKQILKNTGRHIGVFTSPFVLFFNDRIMINDRYISNSEIMYFLNELENFSSKYFIKYNEKFSFFELTFLMCLLYFESRNIDLAIIECGIGGRLDITNCLDTSFQIITSIGYDHMKALGNTLPEILMNKLGIVKTICYTALDDSFKKQLKEYEINNNVKIININNEIKNIKLENNKVTFMLDEANYTLNTLALYQAKNASLAIKICKLIEPSLSYDLISYGLNDSLLPGRMQVISTSPLIILDGAHNKSAFIELVESIKKIKNKKLIVIFSSLRDKEYNDCIKILEDVADIFYFTSFVDDRIASLNDFRTNKEDKILSLDEIKYSDDYIYLFTGSLHFISYLLKNFKKN